MVLQGQRIRQCLLQAATAAWRGTPLLAVMLLGWGTVACRATDQAPANNPGDMILVVGAGGTEEYTETFSQWADDWREAATAAELNYHEVGRTKPAEEDRQRLKQLLDECQSATTSTPLWVVLIGHGTYDRQTAKFNLRGPDVSADELKQWLQRCDRPTVLVNSFSCSGAFLGELSAENRVVVTATKSGMELNFSRFGGYLAESLTDRAADLDHDDQISLLEAYLLASSKVTRFYEEASRLATEHALLEDNHDGKGTPAEFFVGIRAEGQSKSGAAPDGRLAHRYILVPSKQAPQLSAEQLAQRDRLEAEIDALREQKSALGETAYYDQLEELMVDLARLYANAPEDTDARR